MIVPNQFPVDSPDERRLAIVGESPGNDEVNWRVCPQRHGFSGVRREAGELVTVKFCPNCGTEDHKAAPSPFVGASGILLNIVLREAGMDRRRVFVGNCSQSQIAGHDLEDQYNACINLGCRALQDDLAEFKPNCVLVLGSLALRSFHPRGWDKMTDEEEPEAVDETPMLFEVAVRHKPKKKKTKAKFAHTISNWRGSIFASRMLADFDRGPVLKCVAAYHPAAVLRQPEWNALLRFDVARAVKESRHCRLDLPERTFFVPATICA